MTPVFEQLVGRAVSDENFRQQLMSNPDGAVEASGLHISPEERAWLHEITKSRATELENIHNAELRAGSWN